LQIKYNQLKQVTDEDEIVPNDRIDNLEKNVDDVVDVVMKTTMIQVQMNRVHPHRLLIVVPVQVHHLRLHLLLIVLDAVVDIDDQIVSISLVQLVHPDHPVFRV
jgi:hypothetical protein